MSESHKAFYVLNENGFGGAWYSGKNLSEAEQKRIVAVGEGIGRIAGSYGSVTVENKSLADNPELTYGVVGILELIWHEVNERGYEDFETLENAVNFFARQGIEVVVTDTFESVVSQALIGISAE